MRPPLLNACSDIHAHSEEKCPVHGFDGDFAKKKQTAMLNGLNTREELQEMKERRNYHFAVALLTFVAVLTDKSPCALAEVRLDADERSVH